MTQAWIKPSTVFDGHVLRSDLAVRLERHRIVELAPVPTGIDCRMVKGTLAPGFVDLQVNGGGGVLLNTSPTLEGINAISAAHRTYGTVSLLPTVITDAPDVLQSCVDAVIASDALGLHIEGPHIAMAKRGTHAAAHVRPFEPATRDAIAQLREAGKVAMITLAPEVVSEGDIADLIAMGAFVSLGHTEATAAQMRAGFEAGARLVTHLYNAMSPMSHRAAGAAGAAINSDAFVGIIADGHHVDDEMIAMAHRARPVPDRMFLVSDAMPTVGGADHFTLYGKVIRLKNGKLINEDGNLAGAHGTMASGVKRLVSQIGIVPEQALAMATRIPAEAIGQPTLGQLKGRAATDAILLNSDLDVLSTLIDFVA